MRDAVYLIVLRKGKSKFRIKRAIMVVDIIVLEQNSESVYQFLATLVASECKLKYLRKE